MSPDVRRIRVSRVVYASTARIFAFLARPDNHPMLDTSGMIRASAHRGRLTAVGQVFVMDMHNEFRGDHQVENHVVVFEPDRAIGWAPAEPGREPAGHTFVWRPAGTRGARPHDGEPDLRLVDVHPGGDARPPARRGP